MGMKWCSLIAFFVQNSLSAIIFRYATTETTSSERAAASAILLMTESMKCAMSMALLFVEESFSLGRVGAVIKRDVINDPRDCMRLSVPAGIYAVMNTLLQLSAAHVPASLWQVTYQGKALVVALFSVVLLQKQIKRAQWLAILIMGLGLAQVQLSNAKESKQSSMGNAEEQNLVKGMAMLLTACCCSGFASVYTEMVFKQVGAAVSREPKSVWLQNAQLAGISVAIFAAGFAHETMYREPSASEVLAGGGKSWWPLRGFSALAWCLVVSNAVGGLLVALVIKHADNILRSFCSAFATISVAIISMFSFGFDLQPGFVVGALMVLGSSLLYGGTFKLPGAWWNSEHRYSQLPVDDGSPTPAEDGDSTPGAAGLSGAPNPDTIGKV